jgi:hypothetical protein
MRHILHGTLCSPILLSVIAYTIDHDTTKALYLLALSAALHVAFISSLYAGIISRAK